MKWFKLSKMIKLTIWFVVVIFLSSTAIWSQDAEWTIYNTSNSGMPYNGATMLAFGEKGSVWVGTGRWFSLEGGGLAKFDGESWVVYNTANSPLPNNDHFGLAVDPQGNVWAGTEGGLAKFDGTNWTVYNTSNSGLRDNRVAPPVFDDQGHFWAGTWQGGLVEFDGVNWTVYNTANSGLPNNTPFATAFDKQGNLWIGTVGGGLVKFDGTNWTVFNTANSPLPHNTIYFIDFDNQENLWIATDGGGLAKFDGTNWTIYNTTNSGLPSNRIWPIAIDAYDNIWIGTYNRGLAMFDGNEWTVYNTSNSDLPDNTINYLAIDASGDIWIATQSGGLAVYHPQEQTPIVDFNGDGIVDSIDVCMMIDCWGTDEQIYDIAPQPFGDGIVDIQDLILLSEHLFEDHRLVAHWKLDETEGDIAYDSIGEYYGTLQGEPLWQPTEGKIDGALQFDGIDDCVIASSPINPADGDFSVFFWVKCNTPGQVILSQIDATNWVYTDSVEGYLMTGLKGTGRGGGTSLLSQTSITDNNWHRIGFVWDGSYRHLYVDGIEVAVDNAPLLNLIDADHGLFFGTGCHRENFLSGLIDDLRIYNRAVFP
jgi:sugar lactone lactonase YvrE